MFSFFCVSLRDLEFWVNVINYIAGLRDPRINPFLTWVCLIGDSFMKYCAPYLGLLFLLSSVVFCSDGKIQGLPCVLKFVLYILCISFNEREWQGFLKRKQKFLLNFAESFTDLSEKVSESYPISCFLQSLSLQCEVQFGYRLAESGLPCLSLADHLGSGVCSENTCRTRWNDWSMHILAKIFTVGRMSSWLS